MLILVLAHLRFLTMRSLIVLQDALYRFLMQVERCVHELGCGFPSLYPLRASHLLIPKNVEIARNLARDERSATIG